MERLNRFTFSFEDMAFGRSVALHFPLEIQKNLGISEVAPQLLRALDAQKIDALQFLKSRRVRVTCKTAEYRDDLLEGSTFLFGAVPIPVTAADQNIRFVFVRDLPFEVPDDDVKSVFERFGVVHSISPCFFRDFLNKGQRPPRVPHALYVFMFLRGCSGVYSLVDDIFSFIVVSIHRAHIKFAAILILLLIVGVCGFVNSAYVMIRCYCFDVTHAAVA